MSPHGSPHATGFGMADAEVLFDDGFSPWVRALDLTFDAVGPEVVTMRMPFSPAIVRHGGIVCGQALMALADTASVFALWAAAGEVRPCTTVDASVQMMRAIRDADVIGDARVRRLGRTMAFVHVEVHADGDPQPSALATLTLAITREGGPAGPAGSTPAQPA